jgi:hypothetical protein
MATTFTGLRVQDTYNAILKIGDNSNLTGTAKLLSDGLGNASSVYLSTTRLGIGVTPTYQFQTSANAKIGGNLIIAGDLTVNGTTTIIDSTIIAIGDNMIEMAKGNTANTKDIGWYGKIVSTGTKYVGMAYDASTGIATPKFTLGLGTVEPGNTFATTVTGTLVSNLEGNVTGGTISGTTATFTGLVTGIAPTSDLNFATKKYVDDQTTPTPALSAVLAVGNTSGANDIIIADDQKINFGTGSDIKIYHNSTTTNANIENYTGSLYITNYADDADIIFRSDDGSGGVAEYFRLDGGTETVEFTKNSTFAGNITLNGGNLYLQEYIYHNGDDNTYIRFQADRQTLVAGAVEFIDFANTTQDYITIGGGSDIDIKLVSSTNNKYIFIQGSDGKIGINDETPSYAFDVNAETNFTTGVHFNGTRYNKGGSSTYWYASTTNAKINWDARVEGTGVMIHKWNRNADDSNYLPYEENWYDGNSYNKISSYDDGFELNGNIRLVNYGAGNITGTLSRLAGFASNGKFIDVPTTTFLTGSGSVGRFPYYNTANTLDNTTLFYESANKIRHLQTLGAGDNIRDGFCVEDLASMAAGVGGQLTFRYMYTSSGSMTEGAMIRTYKLNATSGDYSSGLKFQVRNTGDNLSTKMTLNPSGFLGLATTTPQKVLHLEGASGSQALISINTDNIGDTAGLLLRAEGGESDSSLRAKGGLFFERTALYGVGKMHLAVNGSANNDSATASNARLTIDEVGSVGIGNTSPSSYDASADDLVIGSGGNSGITIVGGTTGASSLYFADGTSGGSQYTGYIDYQHNGDYMRFGTSNGTERIRIDSSGDLTIQGGRIYLKESDLGNTAIALTRDADEGYVQLFSSGTQTVQIRGNGNSYLNGGNVGIGTTSPSTPLMVNRASNSNEPGIYYDVTGGGSGSVGIGSTAAFGPFIVGNTLPNGNVRGAYSASRMLFNGGGFSFQTSDETSGARTFDDRVKIEIGGNVGIGTTSPTSLLHLQSASSPSIRLVDTTNTNILLVYAQNSDSHIGTYSNHPLVFDTNSTERMRIAAAGAVGIDNSSPDSFNGSGSISSSLVIGKGTSSISPQLTLWQGNSAQATINFASANTGTGQYEGRIRYTRDTGVMDFRTNGVANVLVLSAAGNVGIGTTSPDVKLHVYNGDSGATTVGSASDELILENNTDCGLTIRSGTSSDGVISFADSDDHNIGQVYYSHSSNSMTFRTNDSTAVTIDSSQNVLINRTSNATSQPLQVEGFIDITRITDAALRVYNGSTFRGGFGTSRWGVGPSAILTDSDMVCYAVGNLDIVTSGTSSASARVNTDGSFIVTSGVHAFNGSSSYPGISINVPSGQKKYLGFFDSGTTAYGGGMWYDEASNITSLYSLLNGTQTQHVQLDRGTGNTWLNPSKGAVGLGTTSPTARLDIRSNSASGDNSIDRHVRFRADNGEQRFDFFIGRSGNSSYQGMYDSSEVLKVYIATSGTSYFNGGDVYINDTTAPPASIPAPKFYVNGSTVAISAIGPNDSIRSGLAHYDSTTGNGANIGGQIVLGYRYQNSTYTEGAIIRMYKTNATNGNYSSGLKFQVRNNGEDLISKMTLNGGGDLSVVGSMTAAGDVIAFSDKRVKTNIKTIDNGLQKIIKLRGVSYNRTDIDDKSNKIGVIAQEVKEVLPEVVNYNKDEDKFGVDYGKMAGVFIEAIKELKSEVDSLKQEIKKLKK